MKNDKKKIKKPYLAVGVALLALSGCAALKPLFEPGPPAEPGGPPTPSTAAVVTAKAKEIAPAPWGDLIGIAIGGLGALVSASGKKEEKTA